ncbi:MAG: UDP-N-acetylmuramate:L-alanyl-gamma-D-glutamyl-meso-diaminopimelate ligase [Pseudomonadota bacterium]
MHVHILGICGTFMGGIAALARAAGHKVTGCDEGVYPPMSTQLEQLGIEITDGWDAGQLSLMPDVYVVGNVVSRGNPLMEAILDAGAPYVSGPEWLATHVLRGRRVLAVAGTHGKTTTASLLAHVLEQAGQRPGFLIGGVPGNFDVSARLGDGDAFVVEADEYDTAFFDKRAKFVHYRPEVVVLNNLEFDHADIYQDLAAIEWQFHQLLRCVPRAGRIIANARDANLARVIDQGCWTPVRTFYAPAGENDTAHYRARFGDEVSAISVDSGNGWQRAAWTQQGEHNLQNTLAAVAAADAVGVPVATGLAALERFAGVKRRQEVIAQRNGTRVYDDFAHHPTAISLTLDATRRDASDRRIIAVFEPRSNTMKMGVHAGRLGQAFAAADAVFVLSSAALDWDVAAEFASSDRQVQISDNADSLFAAISAELRPADQVVMMSNGGFSGLRERVANFVMEEM